MTRQWYGINNDYNELRSHTIPYGIAQNPVERDTPSVSVSDLRKWDSDGVEPEAGAPPGANAGDG